MSLDVKQANSLLNEQVAEEIRAWMGRRRLSGAALARVLGVSSAWVSYRLTGAQPIDLNDLARIAAVLDVEAVDLMPRSNEGRVLSRAATSAGMPNERLARLAHRPLRRAKRLTAERLTRQPCPKRRPQTGAPGPTPAGPPRQRRPALIASAE